MDRQFIKSVLLGIVCMSVGFYLMPIQVILTLGGLIWVAFGVNKIVNAVFGSPLVSMRRK